MPDPQPTLSPEAAAFLDRWDPHKRASIEIVGHLAALLAAERRAVWREAAELTAGRIGSRDLWTSAEHILAEIAAALRARAAEEPAA